MKTLMTAAGFSLGVATVLLLQRGVLWLFMHNPPATHPDSKPRYFHNGKRVDGWPT